MKDLDAYFKALGGDADFGDSRRLTFYDAGLDMALIMSRSVDVPTFVEYGAADIGIVGKDVLLEQDRAIVELLDLRLSPCELVVAVPDTSDVHQVSDLHFNSRVATTYPHVTEEFFNSRGIQVEVIPLRGSVELAPLVGLADAIVDITETGATLRANGLRIVGSVAPSTLRLIANPVSYKVHFERIKQLTERLRALVREGVKPA